MDFDKNLRWVLLILYPFLLISLEVAKFLDKNQTQSLLVLFCKILENRLLNKTMITFKLDWLTSSTRWTSPSTTFICMLQKLHARRLSCSKARKRYPLDKPLSRGYLSYKTLWTTGASLRRQAPAPEPPVTLVLAVGAITQRHDDLEDTWFDWLDFSKEDLKPSYLNRPFKTPFVLCICTAIMCVYRTNDAHIPLKMSTDLHRKCRI